MPGVHSHSNHLLGISEGGSSQKELFRSEGVFIAHVGDHPAKFVEEGVGLAAEYLSFEGVDPVLYYVVHGLSDG